MEVYNASSVEDEGKPDPRLTLRYEYTKEDAEKDKHLWYNDDGSPRFVMGKAEPLQPAPCAPQEDPVIHGTIFTLDDLLSALRQVSRADTRIAEEFGKKYPHELINPLFGYLDMVAAIHGRDQTDQLPIWRRMRNWVKKHLFCNHGSECTMGHCYPHAGNSEDAQ